MFDFFPGRLLAGCLLLVLMFALAVKSLADSPNLPSEIAGVNVDLPAPTLTGTEDGETQQSLLQTLLAGISLRQFCRDSFVAPVRIKLKYIEDQDGNRMGHLVHVAFVVHDSLQSFDGDTLTKRVAEKGDSNTEAKSNAMGQQALADIGITDASEKVRYQRVAFTLLDEVHLSGVLRFEKSASAGQSRINLCLDKRFENTWAPESTRSDRKPYEGFYGWITVTELSSPTVKSEAVLVELRLAIHEPKDWFTGSNFLRSKLPLALQETARDLRRRVQKRN